MGLAIGATSASASGFEHGSDTEGNVQIATCDELQYINSGAGPLGQNYILIDDVDCSSFGNFTPIGSSVTPYTGTFNGDNHTITGLSVDASTDCAGLFGQIYNSTVIKNVALTGETVTSTADRVGGLVGCSAGTITNSSTEGNVTGNYCVGGLVGLSSHDLSGDDCWDENDGEQDGGPVLTGVASSATVTGVYDVGGVLGRGENTTISDSFATGDVNNTGNLDDQDEDTGGFVGQLDTSTVTTSYATGTITSETYDTGGFGGDIDSSTVTRSYATGDVVGGEYTGGFVGDTDPGSSDISSTFDQDYATGNVTTDHDAGGFAGDVITATITNSYARGNVVADHDLGSFAGETQESSVLTNVYSTGTADGGGGFLSEESDGTNSVTHSFFDNETSGYSSDPHATGESTATMKTKFFFVNAGWDFTSIWLISNALNDGYPTFRWLHPTLATTQSSITGKQVSVGVTGGCDAHSVDVISESSNSTQDIAYDYPNGMVNFTLTNCASGVTVTVEITFTDVASASAVARKYSSASGSYSTITGAHITYASNTGTTIAYSVTDGGPLDSDGAANGTIVDPVGLGVLTLGAPRTGGGGTAD